MENTKETTIYDANAVQTIPLTVGGYDIEHIAEPISDERYFQYDDRCKTIIADEGEAVASERVEAASALWDEIVSDVRGYDGDRPSDWKSFIDGSERLACINQILISDIQQTEVVGLRSWGNTGDAIVLEAFFNDDVVKTRHFLRRKTIVEDREFEKLQKIPLKTGKGLKKSHDIIVPSRARQKVELYDKMKAKDAEGYASRVPAWHKVAVIDHLFGNSVNRKK